MRDIHRQGITKSRSILPGQVDLLGRAIQGEGDRLIGGCVLVQVIDEENLLGHEMPFRVRGYSSRQTLAYYPTESKRLACELPALLT